MFTSKRLVRDIEVDICAATSANYVSSLATVTVKTMESRRDDMALAAPQ
jgi:hypothetical protein